MSIPNSTTPRNGGCDSRGGPAPQGLSPSITSSPKTRKPSTSPTSPSRTFCRSIPAGSFQSDDHRDCSPDKNVVVAPTEPGALISLPLSKTKNAGHRARRFSSGPIIPPYGLGAAGAAAPGMRQERRRREEQRLRRCSASSGASLRSSSAALPGASSAALRAPSDRSEDRRRPCRSLPPERRR